MGGCQRQGAEWVWEMGEGGQKAETSSCKFWDLINVQLGDYS